MSARRASARSGPAALRRPSLRSSSRESSVEQADDRARDLLGDRTWDATFKLGRKLGKKLDWRSSEFKELRCKVIDAVAEALPHLPKSVWEEMKA